MGEDGPVTPTAKGTTRKPKTDAALVAEADHARAELIEAVGADEVGEHLGYVAEADRVLTHWFAARHPGYAGWRWAVTLARAPRQKAPTVNEIVLLPGADALVAPEWVPWKDRVGKEDLRPGDLVPTTDDDPRLVPGYLVGDEPLDGVSARERRELVRDVGLGRERVLSVVGRDEAAARWHEGDHGPDAAIAKAAPGHCGSCGFLVRLAGPLATMFGVCANASSPSDGQAVSFDHGCGAHSDVRVETSVHQPVSMTPFFDTLGWDVFDDVELEPRR
jgi:hypothetical protein